MFLAFAVFQFFLGFVGIEDWLGVWWASGAVVVAFAFRFMLPLTIGTYLAVVNVYEYDWWVGVLVAAPGIAFMLPAMVMGIIEAVFTRE